PNGRCRTVASGSSDGTVRLWNVTDPAHPAPLGRPLTGHTNTVSSIAFNREGNILVSGSGDDTVRLWNVAGPITPLGQPLTDHTYPVGAVAFNPNGHSFASG